MRLIPVSEVICLEAADKYVTVITAASEPQVRMPLRELATRLAGIEPADSSECDGECGKDGVGDAG